MTAVQPTAALYQTARNARQNTTTVLNLNTICCEVSLEKMQKYKLKSYQIYERWKLSMMSREETRLLFPSEQQWITAYTLHIAIVCVTNRHCLCYICN